MIHWLDVRATLDRRRGRLVLSEDSRLACGEVNGIGDVRVDNVTCEDCRWIYEQWAITREMKK